MCHKQQQPLAKKKKKTIFTEKKELTLKLKSKF